MRGCLCFPGCAKKRTRGRAKRAPEPFEQYQPPTRKTQPSLREGAGLSEGRCAKKRTRTSTGVTPLAPQASASAIPPPSRGVDQSGRSELQGSSARALRPFASLLGKAEVRRGLCFVKEIGPQERLRGTNAGRPQKLSNYLRWIQLVTPQAGASHATQPRPHLQAPTPLGLRRSRATGEPLAGNCEKNHRARLATAGCRRWSEAQPCRSVCEPTRQSDRWLHL